MSKKQQAIELWRTCFNDTEEFIQFYFTNKYRDENTLLSYEGGTAIAVTQMLPYPMRWCNTQIPTSYISGACTSPAARSKGIMKELLSEAFMIMKSRNIALSTLIPAEPWLFGYYRKSGYTTVFDYTLEEHLIKPFPERKIGFVSCIEELSGIAESLFSWFTQKMELRNSCILHPYDDYKAILQDLYANGGKLFTAHNEAQEFIGAAFAIPYNGKNYVSEILYETPEIKQELLQAIANEWGNEQIECHVPPVPGQVIHKGMARIIDAKQMLAIYALHYPEKKFSLKLHDEQLPENNGCYFLEKGNCIHTGNPSDTPDFNMDIQALTQVIMGYHPELLSPLYFLFETGQQPYMSLMLE